MKPDAKHIVVIRLSAIGDVALCLPVILRLLQMHKSVHVTMITKPQTAFLFENIDRLSVIKANVLKEHKGIFGVLKLAKLIKKSIPNIYAVVDLHNVLRSKMLMLLLMPFTKKSSTILKNRNQKKAICSSSSKPVASNNTLPHITSIYSDAFRKLGFTLDTRYKFPAVVNSKHDTDVAAQFYLQNATAYNIAFAPFAKHAGKMLTWSTVLDVISQLQAHKINVFMYAGMEDESLITEALSKHSHVISTFSLSFAQQTALLHYMQCAVTMDSANMHLASLQNVPLISIWGATHTQIGFAPLDTNATILEITKQDLPCRPCSVYGNKPCHLNATPYACLSKIQATEIVNAIYTKLGI